MTPHVDESRGGGLHSGVIVDYSDDFRVEMVG
jgi:hypothetical protein